MIDAREMVLDGIKLRLGAYAANAYIEQGKLSDGEEELFRGLLNLVLGCELQNMNLERENFPAIDLGDDDKKLAVQVTSTGTRDKVRHTLKEFFDNQLETRFSRLIVLVVGRAERFSTPPKVPGGFDFQPRRDILDLVGLLREIRRLPERKLAEVAAYLEQRVNLPDPEELLHLPMQTALEDGRFVGREEELDLLGERFEGEHVVALSGLGGMGKTELALKFGREYWLGRAYFVRFERDLFHTVVYGIADGVPGLSREGRREEDVYAEVMAVLRKGCSRDLLIVDNADQEQENFDKLRKELSDLPLRVLITTRCDAPRVIHVKSMAPEVLHGIFRLHEVDIPREEMDALIEAVDGHTLTVDLMARLLRTERRRDAARVLLEALRSRNLAKDTFGKIGAAFPDAERQARINEHLRAVFRVAKLSAGEQTVLRFAALLPETGLDSELFVIGAVWKKPKKRSFFDLFRKKPKILTDQEVRDILKDLANKGWLEWEGDLVRIHPVIRIVCIEELKPAEKNCDDFLFGIERQYDQKRYEAVKFRQMAGLFETASEVLEDRDGFWAGNAGYFWDQVAEHKRALSCELLVVEKRENERSDSASLAKAYNNLGHTYGSLGDQRKALEYHQKALTIREKVLPEDHPSLAISYNNLGHTYGALGDQRKALEYHQKALAIWEKVLPEKHLDLAQSYNNVGHTYGVLGEQRKALEYHQKALAIREKVLPEDHPDLAQSYNNMGIIYGGLGEHEKALEYELKALGIFEKIPLPNHPHLATSYSNVGYIYSALGEHGKALEYQQKALVINEKVLLGNHPSLALSCNNVACAYFTLGQLDIAAKYMRRAADIINQSSLPEEHPDRADYNRWAERFEREARQAQTTE